MYATARQIQRIYDLWEQVSRQTEHRVRLMALRNWLRRTCKVHHENFLTVDLAQDAIEGLKRMVRRKVGKEGQGALTPRR